MNKSEIAPNFIEFTIPGHMNNYKSDEHFKSKVPRVRSPYNQEIIPIVGS